MSFNWLQNDVDFSPHSDQWIAGWRIEMNNIDVESPRYKELQTLIEERMRELDTARRQKRGEAK